MVTLGSERREDPRGNMCPVLVFVGGAGFGSVQARVHGPESKCGSGEGSLVGQRGTVLGTAWCAGTGARRPDIGSDRRSNGAGRDGSDGNAEPEKPLAQGQGCTPGQESGTVDGKAIELQ